MAVVSISDEFGAVDSKLDQIISLITALGETMAAEFAQTNGDLTRLAATTLARFDAIDGRLDSIDSKLASVEDKLAEILRRLPPGA